MNCPRTLPRLESGPAADPLWHQRWEFGTDRAGRGCKCLFPVHRGPASPLSLDVWPVSWLWEPPTLNMRDWPCKGKERKGTHKSDATSDHPQDGFSGRDLNTTILIRAGLSLGVTVRSRVRSHALLQAQEARPRPVLDSTASRKAPSPFLAAQEQSKTDTSHSENPRQAGSRLGRC